MTTLDTGAAVSTVLVADAAATAHSRRRLALLTKQVLDRLAGVALLAALAPALAAVALLIRVTSPGPALYRQTRYGRDGRPFRMWKFRTMVVGADLVPPPRNESDGLLFKVRDDPRVTPVGRFLRKWSLDELPQLVNVVCGQMSLVGPRPLPVHPSRYTVQEARRLAVRPGITGLWQVSGRSDLGWHHCSRLDLDYVDQWSLTLDLRILLRTAAAVLRRAGAY